MLTFVRAGLAAALVVLLPVLAAAPAAAEKAYQRDDLADAAIKLEAKIKSDAGQVDQAGGDAAARRRRRLRAQRFPHRPADPRADRGGGAQRQRQLAAARQVGPADSPGQRSGALRAARSRRHRGLYRLSAHRQSGRGGRKPAASSRAASRTAACGGRRSMRCGSRSSCARSPTCASSTSACARITASACSITRSMRMRPRRAPASSSRRICRASAPTSRRSWRSPGRTSRRCRSTSSQLCVEGLKHGERYTVTLRAGIPSVVKETLAKTADFNIYVRDRKPFVRFTDKAYVLPRTGQRGIPVVSVNTTRGRDRDLSHRRPQPDRDRARPRLPAQSRPLRLRAADASSRARRSGKARMKVEPTLNADVTTAFPVDQAIGTLAPGVYVMHAGAAGATPDDMPGRRDPMVHRLRSRPHGLLRQ